LNGHLVDRLDQSADLLVATLHHNIILVDFLVVTLIDSFNCFMGDDDSGTTTWRIGISTARFKSTCTDSDPGMCTRCCRGSNGSAECSKSTVELMPENAANTCTAANVTNMSNSSEGKRRCVGGAWRWSRRSTSNPRRRPSRHMCALA
jgi:hypothetical protein